jgi:hypothetical protein
MPIGIPWSLKPAGAARAGHPDIVITSNAFHPFVIRLHLCSSDFLRPMAIDVEGEKLRRRKDDVVKPLKELSHRLVLL